MQSAMDVRVFGLVGPGQAIEHLAGLLGRRRVIEIDQRLAIDLHRQRGEILADLLDIIGAIADSRMHDQPRALSHAPTASINASRRPACSMPSIASPT